MVALLHGCSATRLTILTYFAPVSEYLKSTALSILILQRYFGFTSSLAQSAAYVTMFYNTKQYLDSSICTKISKIKATMIHLQWKSIGANLCSI